MHTSRLLLAFTVACLLGTVALGGSLYPSCGGKEKSVTAKAGKEEILYTFDDRAKLINFTCLAYEVRSILEKEKWKSNPKDHCLVEHQTEYNYDLFLRATFKADGAKTTRDYRIRDIAGGSIAGMTVRLPKLSKFAIVLKNLATDKRCKLEARAIFDVEDMDDDDDNEVSNPIPTPALVGVHPPIIYATNSRPSYFVLKHPADEHSKAEDDVLTLADFDESCGSTRSSKRLSYEKDLPATHEPTNQLSLAAYSYKFQAVGMFRLCYRRPSDPTKAATEIAVIAVFSGNPAYYETVAGASADGAVLVGTMVTIKFYGHNLDSRPGGDRAKFVDDSSNCSHGSPAGGVPESSDLGPSDDYGPNTTFTLWQWMMVRGGSYRVCYKRRDAEWTEVLSIREAGPGNAPHGDEYPTPVNPNSHEKCPMAPAATPEDGWENYRSVRIVMGRKVRYVQTILDVVANVFCLPRAAFSIVHLTHDDKGRTVAYVVFLCEGIKKEDGTAACSSYERSNYAVRLSRLDSERMLNSGIVEVTGIPSFLALHNENITYQRGYATVALSVCIALFLLTAASFLTVMKFR